MAHRYWPFFDLRIRTARLELRVPNDDDLAKLARLAARGIHDPEAMPFAVPWTRKPSPDLERGLLQWHWSRRAALAPDDWWLEFGVSFEGQLVGVQGLAARQFQVLRSVFTGSWVGRGLQRRGIGREMRAAVLHLAFAGLGAETATSEALADNAASAAVSAALGYRPDGTGHVVVEGKARAVRRFRIDRAEWEESRRGETAIEGIEPCLPLLGAGTP